MTEELELESVDWKAVRRAQQEHRAQERRASQRLDRSQRDRNFPDPSKPSREYGKCHIVPRLNPYQVELQRAAQRNAMAASGSESHRSAENRSNDTV
jgi:hypothetical protein